MSVEHGEPAPARATGRGGPRRLPVLVVLTVLLALAGAGALVLAGTGASGPTRAEPVPAAASLALAGAAVVVAPADPVRLDIPAIDVHTPLLTLGLNPDGTVEVPSLDTMPEANQAGWYDGSPTPGALGPSVILGHVDSARFGPSVFYDLAALVPGDRVEVTRTDASTVTFQVDSVARYPKDAFPTDAVYGDIDHAGLRLITCGGEFDRAARSYKDNIVVYASAVSAGRGE
ncbi:class F sortase [Pseudonocardia xinjiangensis]|uniref:class F sortase n=1 Tax=Pseudonocardia xinjiangensis TaxID=75289 RepID=UPI003D927F1C